MFLQSLFKKELEARHLSIRAASREIGVSHTTLSLFMKGEAVDLKTTEAISNWLGISVRDALGYDKDSDVASAVASLLETEPGLKTIFQDALADYQARRLSADDLKDIIRYAAFRLDLAKERKEAIES